MKGVIIHREKCETGNGSILNFGFSLPEGNGGDDPSNALDVLQGKPPGWEDS